MTTRAVEQVDDWDSHPFSGGYRGLHDLADDDFSGIVAAGPTRLCMTAGRVIGILDGSIEDFEDASGTAYEAPSPALPLLAVMQERTDEVRAQYYTEETSIEEVDRTLTQGNFTGFVELSENVLSGDYYLVYHQGRSMSVAWVGASSNLLIDDEAFDQANDEVGIYEVRPVDIEVSEIPEPAEPATGTAASSGTDAESTAGPESTDESGPADTATDDDASVDDTATPGTDTEPSPDEAETGSTGATAADAEPESTGEQHGDGAAGGEAASSGAASSSGSSAREEPTRETDRSAREAADRRASTDAEREDRGERSTADRERAQADRNPTARSDTQSGQQRGGTQERGGRDRDAGSRRDDASGGKTGAPRSGAVDNVRGRQRQEANTGSVGELETRSIPSLDPDRTSEPSDDGNGKQGPTAGTSQATASGAGTRSDPEARSPGSEHGREPERAGQPNGSGTRQGASQREPERARTERPPADSQQGERRREPAESEPEPRESGPTSVEELEAELEDREAEIDELESQLETVEDERDELEAERDELKAERDELRERVEQLESRIDELRTEEGGESVADRERLSPGEAIEGTNLFVRYASKGDATLEAAHAGNAEAGAVNDNLEIQYHTQFEADDVAVNGEPFTEYLTETIQYSFVEWVVRVLPYEIRDTGHQEALGPLYDALPKIDRAELNGAITVQYQEDGEEHRSQERFDVVLRDRMGNPLLVANMNESRQPASQSMMEGLISASQRVGESKETLAGSFLVTSSFFEPEAMEAAADATGSGLLSRDKRESFVKLSRKDGFHLCLVEAREENFNLSVPEI